MNEPRSRRKLFIVLGVLAAVLVLSAITVFVTLKLANRQTSKAILTDKDCLDKAHTDYIISIENDQMDPKSISASQCDTLTVINKDETNRLIAFGPHDSHTPYDGVSEQVLLKNQSLQITLVQAGNFIVHDHAHQDVQSTFTVDYRH